MASHAVSLLTSLYKLNSLLATSDITETLILTTSLCTEILLLIAAKQY